MRGLRLKSEKKNKYSAERAVVDNVKFDSRREAHRYSELKLLLRANEIVDLKLHPVFAIVVKDKLICNVELDFSYFDSRDKSYHHEDVKGRDNPMSKLKRRLVEVVYGIKVEIIK